MEDAGSEGENQNKDRGNVYKPKRQMKTPFQLETLEKAYAMETYPSEAMRAELSEKLGLSDRQLQMWFCHRRLKDKNNASSVKKPRKSAVVATPEYPKDSLVEVAAEPDSDYGSGSGSGSGSSPYGSRDFPPNVYSRGDDVGGGRRYYESPRTTLELRAIACVEAQLGEPLREDGPILGMEFDPLPPDAFGAPIASMEERRRPGHAYDNKVYMRRDAMADKASGRSLHEYQFLHDQPSARYYSPGQPVQTSFHDVPVDGPITRTPSIVHGNELSSIHGVQGHLLRVCRVSQDDREGQVPAPSAAVDALPQRDSLTTIRLGSQHSGHPTTGVDDSFALTDGKVLHEDTELHLDRKRKNDEARIAREVEAHESRIRKAHEKENMLRRKNEERMRKEMERYDRERRKEEERLMRERQREEERLLREQRREMERREKFLLKESIRAEKRRQKEELRREKEAERRKAALEKATARRIAKESMELMDDEQLELMELAAMKKGLPSIIHLDHASLQNLDLFRDSLCVFPPQSVQLKRPFAIQPWMALEENVGNLLMAWRFLITFSDVLGLWPFTLDEFVQAFHDFDSRILGEIHVALLKTIIKDIEDVARTPATGLGTNQYTAINLEGGHPHIVEGAYAWGFDIRKWQKHLSPLTWPEVFRQLALSAGFGPRLKKRSAVQSCLHDFNEIKGCEDIISNLRSGSAAKNAIAIMRDKGLLLPRRNRHRLTPGTVKFAAFHVLSLEGSKGLTVLELADKIQKSGLRDLTTSKTPEASISVALTRDAKLFERIAPSTYRVRAAYRKDPADAEAILSEARKKIRIFENGMLDREDADGVERDGEVERDEESEGDVDEDPEVDDVATPSRGEKDSDLYNEVSTCPDMEKERTREVQRLQNEAETGPVLCSLSGSKDALCQSIGTEKFGTEEDTDGRRDDPDSVEIDESKSGESWVRGLTEGEYSFLSVDERSNALVALIGIANEGNSIRLALEDRLEAASALKKQMWTEAQLDKSRVKDEFISKVDVSSFMWNRPEVQPPTSAVEGNHSPLPVSDVKNIEASPSTAENGKLFPGSQGIQNDLGFSVERTSAAAEPSAGLDNFSTQYGYVSRRSRAQLKAYIAQRAEEIYVYRSLPLGLDRRHNRYWQFVASASQSDPSSGRIFVELHDGSWRVIDTEEAFDALLSSLDTRGIRESHLRIMMLKVKGLFKESVRRNASAQRGSTVKSEAKEMDSSPDSGVVYGSNNSTLEMLSSLRVELGRNKLERKAALRRYQDFQRWTWRESFNSYLLRCMQVGRKRSEQLLGVCENCLATYFFKDAHCPSCNKKIGVNFAISCHLESEAERKRACKEIITTDSSLPLGIRLLKALIAVVEVSIPFEAFQSSWTEDCRRSWAKKLNASSTPEELLQMLTLLESAIKQDYLSSDFEMTKELLGLLESTKYDTANANSPPVLPWIPQTAAAVALRLLELDASLIYVKQAKPEPSEPSDDKLLQDFIKLPLKQSIKLKESDPSSNQYSILKENSGVGSRGRNSQKRAHGSQERSNVRKLQKGSSVLKSDVSRPNTKNKENLNQGLRQQGQRMQEQVYVRGRRTVRKRRVENRAVEEGMFLGQMARAMRPKVTRDPSRILGEGWGSEQKRPLKIDAADDSTSSSSEAAAESDDNEVEYERENWDDGFDRTPNGWTRNSAEASEDEVDSSDNDNVVEVAIDEDSEADEEMIDVDNEVLQTIENEDGLDSSDSEDYSE